jgi:hypothetical protein
VVSRWRFAVSLLCSALLLSCITAPSRADEQHFLDYSEDNFKVAFVSGNLTAAVTHDWPRVVFRHTTDPFSPTFEVGMPRIYLFNDSNADGMFTNSEIKYVSYLDENHVLWNVTPVEFLNDTVAGEYAHFRMNATLDLYLGLDNETVSVPEWANITFWFRISERNLTISNSQGSYVVKGGTDVSLNYTLNVSKSMNLTGIVVEQLLQGGGSAFMFILKQRGSHSDVVDRMVSSRFDERVYGSNFTNDFLATSLAEQDISFAKEDGTVKAYYRWDSVPSFNSSGNESAALIRCSFLTTGTGMILHSAFLISNATGTLFQEASLGIDESAFTAKITDWMKENAVAIALFVGSIAAIVAVAALFVRHRKHSKDKDAKKPPEEDESDGS